MKKRSMIWLGLLLSLLLSGCSAKTGSDLILPIILGVLGGAALLLGIMQIISYIKYVRYARRKNRKAQRLSPTAYVCCILGAVLIGFALLTGCDVQLLPPLPEIPYASTESQQQTDDTQLQTENTQQTTQDTTPSVSLEEGWIENEDGSRSYRDDTGMLVVGWKDMDNRRYFFDVSGRTLSGWQEVEGIQRYFREDGSMARGEEVIDGQKRFFTSTGAEVLVANPWNALPEGYSVETVQPSSTYATQGTTINKEIVRPLTQMIDACNAAMKEKYGSGASRCCAVSGYRAMDVQKRLYNNKVNYYLNQGLARDAAEVEAAKVVARPGTSEHQLGLAVDMVDTQYWSLDERQEKLPAQIWLMENSWKYGFILRYPNGKTDVTGIIYEPWHYRYVGVELATELYESGLTLEEYLQGLD